MVRTLAAPQGSRGSQRSRQQAGSERARLHLAGANSKKIAPMEHWAGYMRTYVPEGRLARITLATRAAKAPSSSLVRGRRMPRAIRKDEPETPGTVGTGGNLAMFFTGPGAGFRASPIPRIHHQARIHAEIRELIRPVGRWSGDRRRQSADGGPGGLSGALKHQDQHVTHGDAHSDLAEGRAPGG
jgi:hypothetical protein